MDLSVQKPVKAHLKKSFESWYSEQIILQMSNQTSSADALDPVEMPLSLMKELMSKWLVKMHQAISNKPEIVTNGFKEAGISKVLEDYLPLARVQ